MLWSHSLDFAGAFLYNKVQFVVERHSFA
jgi:hypothetical protein